MKDKLEERLKALYEWRQIRSEELNAREELEGLCWWVDADVIDREWTLNKFHELLQVHDEFDALYFAALKLINYMDIDPKKVLECIDMMLDKLNKQGIYFTWDESAQEILKKSLLNDNVKDQAINLVHKFGSKGFLQYRELLCEQ